MSPSRGRCPCRLLVARAFLLHPQPVVSAMSLELAIISALAGIALGLRYKVMILLCAVASVMTFAMVVGIARGDHLWSIISAVATLETAVQLGYLAGISIRARLG